MTQQEFTEKMNELSRSDDYEFSHEEADKLMCRALSELGYAKGVEIFEKMCKWYA